MTANDYRAAQDRLFQGIADRQVEAGRREREAELVAIMRAQGATEKMINVWLKGLRVFADTEYKTDSERQAGYDERIRVSIQMFADE